MRRNQLVRGAAVFLLLVALVIGSSTVLAATTVAGTWTAVNPGSDGRDVALATAADGTVGMAYTRGNAVYFRSFNNGVWSGEAVVFSGSFPTYEPSIAYSGNIPYVSWSQQVNLNSSRPYVAVGTASTGGTWSGLGGSNAGNGLCPFCVDNSGLGIFWNTESSDIAIDPVTGQPALAYNAYDTSFSNGDVYYVRWNGGAWVRDTGGALSTLTVNDGISRPAQNTLLGMYPSLSFNSAGTPFIAYGEFISTPPDVYNPLVRSLSGGTWSAPFNLHPIADLLTPVEIAFSGSTAMAVWTDISGGAYFRTFNGTAWSGVGTVTGGGTATRAELTSTPFGYLVALNSGGSAGTVTAKIYNGTDWDDLTTGATVQTGVAPDRVPAIAVSGNYTPVVAYITAGTGSVPLGAETFAPTGLTAAINDVAVTEGNSGATSAGFTVTRSGSLWPARVTFTTANGSTNPALGGTDYVTATGTVTFGYAGTNTQPVTVTVNGDTLYERNETYFVDLTAPSNGLTISDAQGLGSINNDDPPPVISIGTPIAITEGTGVGTTTLIFPLSLNTASGLDATVTVNTTAGTATAADFTPIVNGTATIPAGQLTGSITVTITRDALDEEDTEDFTVTISAPVDATLGATTTATGTITDDDPPPTVTITDVTLAEGNAGTTVFTFTVALSAPSGRMVTVNYATAPGVTNPATAGTDYTSTSGTVTFTPGDISETVAITVNGDTTFETNETFTVALSGGANYTVAGSDLSGLGTITNDDSPPQISIDDVIVDEAAGTASFTISLNVPSGAVVTGDYATASNTATTGQDFIAATGVLTINPGDTTFPIVVPISDDPLDEPNETYFVNLTNIVGATVLDGQGQGTITDDDDPPAFNIDDAVINPEGNGGGTANAVFTVTLSGPSGRTITINYTTTAGTASPGQDYTTTTGTLIFAPGSSSETITVPVVQDGRDDEDSETFFVQLSGPTNTASTGNDAEGIGTIVDDDATPTLSINDVTLAEGNPPGTTTFTFTVTLSAPSNRAVSVDYATVPGTLNPATAGTDYTSSTGSLNIPAGSITETLDITVARDTVFELDETFFVQLTGATNAAILDGEAVGTITNDDTQPGLSIDDANVIEGNSGTTNLVFTVTRTGTSSLPITVDYSTADDTASAGADYTSTSGTLTFNPGDPAAQTITVVVDGDTVDEIDETLFVNLSNASNATVTDAQGLGTITDDDITVITIDDADVEETDAGTDTALVFTVMLSNANSRVVTLDYATALGVVFPATAGIDYTPLGGTLTFNPGDPLTQTISVPVLGDNSDEQNETLLVNLINVSANALINDGLGVGTILDNDGPPTLNIDSVTLNEGNAGTTNFVFTARLTVPSAFPVTFQYVTANNTASAGTDYTALVPTSATILAGDTDQIIIVTVNGDTLNEANETFFVDLININGATAGTTRGTGTITNDDPLPVVSIGNAVLAEGDSGTTPFNFDVTLDTVSGRDVTVTVSSADGTTNPAIAGVDYTALTTGTTVIIPAGTTGPVPVTVNVTGETLYERDETFTVTLSSPVNATIGTGTGTGTITNDDTAPGLSITSGFLLEGTGGTNSASRLITLDAVSGVDVSVTYDTADGTATAPADYTAVTAQTVTIPAGDLDLPIAIPVVTDAIDENNETFTITLSSPVDATITNGTATITIEDDDTVGFTVDPLTANTAEDGSSDAFTVVLTSQPLSNVVITLTSTDLGEVTVGPTSLTFTPADWDQPQTVTVFGVNDDAIDGNQAVNVTVAIDPAASDDAFDTVAAQNVVVTNADNDLPGITLLRPGGTLVIVEGGANGSIGVNLNTQPTADVTLTFTPDAQCEINTGTGFGGAGGARSLTIAAANWNILTPVAVRAIDDLLFEGPHTCLITVAAPTSTDPNYNGAAPAFTLDSAPFTVPGTIPASITDNDVASATPVNTETPTPTSTGTLLPTGTPTAVGTPAAAATEVPVIGTFTLADGRRVTNDGRTITITNPNGTTQTIISGRVTLANNQITVFDNAGRPVVDLVTVVAQSLGGLVGTPGIIPPGGVSQFVTLTGTGIAGRGTTTTASLVVTNTSGAPLTNAVITINAGGLGLSFGPGAFNPLDQLIAALTGASTADAQSAELRWAIGTLAPGQSVTRVVTVTIPATFTGNSFVLTSTLTADGIAPETDTVFYSVASGLPATGEALGLPPLLIVALIGGVLLTAVTLYRRRPQP